MNQKDNQITNYKLSILIPSWNGENYIEACINSILKNSYENYEIISIAGGNDKAYKISLKIQNQHPNKVIALSRKEGKKNEALNTGLDKVSGDIIVITDVDCIYPEDWLRKINEKFQNEEINVITGLNLPYKFREGVLVEYNKIKVGYNLIKFEDGKKIIGNKLWGGNAAFRSKVFFEKIGRFEIQSTTGDDKILGMQFNEKGEVLYYYRDIYVYTEHYSNNLKKFIKQRIRWARDLFINYERKDIFKRLFLLGIGLFKFIYPIGVLIFWILFLPNFIFSFLFLLSPWIIFYTIFILYQIFELKVKSERVNEELGKNLNYLKAIKIVPLMYFVYGIISIVSFLKLKDRKWYH